MIKAAMIPISGLKKKANRKNPIPERPLLDATQPTATERQNQKRNKSSKIGLPSLQGHYKQSAATS
jgi:hypothetical protein